jgi:putative tryptophan/tyrosine transport system substrate-binding protein
MTSIVARRKLLAALCGSAVAWPIATSAQQPAMPVIGYLRSGSRAASSQVGAAFRQGLSSMGFIEGRNVARLPIR